MSVVGIFSFLASFDLDLVLERVPDFLMGESFRFGAGAGDLDLKPLPFEPDLLKGDLMGDLLGDLFGENLFGENLPLDFDLDLDLLNGERPLGGDLYLGLRDLPLKGDLPLDHDLRPLDIDLENCLLLGDLENDLLGDLENDRNLDLDRDLLGVQERLGVKDRLGDLAYLGESDRLNLLGLTDLEREKLLLSNDLDLYLGNDLDLQF